MAPTTDPVRGTFLHHPTPGFSGVVNIDRQSVEFVDGVAPLPDGGFIAGWLRNGYMATEDTMDRPGAITYDPGTDTVDGVLSRLNDPATTDAERDRILDAEAAGKGRKSIAAWTPQATPEDLGDAPGSTDTGDAMNGAHATTEAPGGADA